MVEEASSSPAEQPVAEQSPNAAEAPVASGNPLLQLVLIPLLIVLCFVLVVLLFSRLAHPGVQPEDLVRSLERADRDSWQNAVLLAQVLGEPRYAGVKRDPQLAGRLARLARDHIQAGRMDPASVRLRSYLCRALGEFECSQVLPVLVLAAKTRRDRAEVEVQQAAAEAIAVLAGHELEGSLPQHAEARDAMLDLTRASPASAEPQPLSLRAAAAFALGVLGGPRAEQRLAELLQDPAADVRFNAALGLARHGDPRALPVLTEMLDPRNQAVVAGETTERGRGWKRELVLTNAIRGLLELARVQPDLACDDASRFLRIISQNDPSPAIRLQALKALQVLPASSPSPPVRL